MKTYTFSASDSVSDDGYAVVVIFAKTKKQAIKGLTAELDKMGRRDLRTRMVNSCRSSPFSIGDALFSNVQAR